MQRLIDISSALRYRFISPVNDFIILTGADSSHFRSLKQLLKSVLQYEKTPSIIVFDLGLAERERKELLSIFPTIQLRIFDYSQYPGYFSIKIKAGEYAWKPIIISDILKEFRAAVCWMDAGNVLTGSLTMIRKIINSIGLYSPRSSGTIRDWTHPKTLEFMKVSEEILDMRNVNGACIAVNPRIDKAMTIINQWRKCALIRECIAPEGSSRENHRQDQAVLSVLIHQAGMTKQMPGRKYGFITHQDID